MKPIVASRQLHAFSAVAQHRSFTSAGKDLSMTQSAVSHAIRALERNLGVQLVSYSRRRVLLTPAGGRILRHTRKILRGMAAIRAQADATADKNGRIPPRRSAG